jgi:hypothetical protein
MFYFRVLGQKKLSSIYYIMMLSLLGSFIASVILLYKIDNIATSVLSSEVIDQLPNMWFENHQIKVDDNSVESPYKINISNNYYILFDPYSKSGTSDKDALIILQKDKMIIKIPITLADDAKIITIPYLAIVKQHQAINLTSQNIREMIKAQKNMILQFVVWAFFPISIIFSVIKILFDRLILIGLIHTVSYIQRIDIGLVQTINLVFYSSGLQAFSSPWIIFLPLEIMIIYSLVLFGLTISSSVAILFALLKYKKR